ncbi:MAG: PadR family transcriptional regulator [Chloroflexota bacterium]|nr:PadR family transcriptional regulator [Chloroflexota bacterium]
MNRNWPSEWLRGVLIFCVLQTLEGAPTYGYAIASALKTSGIGEVKGGTLYPLLSRLEDAGHVTTYWAEGNGGPGRKYFALTDEGRRALASYRIQWEAFKGTVDQHLNAAEVE